MLLNCTVEVDTIETLSAYEHLCLQPKTLCFTDVLLRLQFMRSLPLKFTRHGMYNISLYGASELKSLKIEHTKMYTMDNSTLNKISCGHKSKKQ